MRTDTPARIGMAGTAYRTFNVTAQQARIPSVLLIIAATVFGPAETPNQTKLAGETEKSERKKRPASDIPAIHLTCGAPGLSHAL